MLQLLGHLAGVCRVREQHCHQDNEPAAWQILPATVAYDLARQRQYKLGWGSCSITLVSKMTFLFFLRQAAAVPSTPPSSLAAAVTTTLVANRWSGNMPASEAEDSNKGNGVNMSSQWLWIGYKCKNKRGWSSGPLVRCQSATRNLPMCANILWSARATFASTNTLHIMGPTPSVELVTYYLE